MKKKLSSLLAGLLLLSTLAACTQAPEAEVDGGTSDAASDTNGGGEIQHTITTLSPIDNSYAFDFDTKNEYSVYQQMEEMLAEKGIKLEYELISEDQYEVAIQTRMAAAIDLPNFANLSDLDNETIINLGNQGIVLDMNDILEHSEGPARDELSGDWKFAKDVTTTEDGKTYWIGNMRESIHDDYRIAVSRPVLIRQDWLTEVGLDVPTSPETFRDALIAFNEQDVNGNGANDETLLVQSDQFVNGIAQWYGLPAGLIGYEFEEGKISTPWYEPGARDYFEYMISLVEAGVYTPDIVSNTELSDQILKENKGSATRNYSTQGWLEPQTGDENASYLPIGPFEATDLDEPTNYIEGSRLAWDKWGFTNSCTDLEGAAKLLDIIFDEEFHMLYYYGIEGETYEMVDGVPTYLPSWNSSNWETNASQRIATGYNFLRYVLPYASDHDATAELANAPDFKAEYEQASYEFPKTTTDPDTYMALTTTEEAERLTAIKTELETYSAELATLIIIGEKPIDDASWETYMQDLKDLGLDEYVQIMQDRVDRIN